MNKFIKKTLIISASALMFLSVGSGVNNVQARRYHYRYHRRVSRHRYRRHVRRSSRRRINRKRVRKYHKKARKRYYHIKTAFVNAGWTSNYRHYKNEMRYIKRMYHEGKLIKNRDGFDAQGLDSQGYDSEGDNPNPEGFSPKQLKRLHRMAPKFERQLKYYTLQDINNDRENNGVAPLRDNSLMDRVAAVRARQLDVPGNFTHYDSSHNNVPYEDEDAQKLGINDGYAGENIAAPTMGSQSMISADGTDCDPNVYNNYDGRGLAHEAEDAMFNYDAVEDNGHRENILDPDYKYVGVGAYADPKDPAEYSLVEDFTNDASYNNGSDDTGDNNSSDNSLGAPTIYNQKFLLYHQPKGSYVTYGKPGYATVHRPGESDINYFP